MSSSSSFLDPAIADWLRSCAERREDPLLARLREATAVLPQAAMQISVEQGLLLGLLARLLGARRAIEVGVFTGYSALCIARALPPDGRLVACDVSREWTALARPFWREAGVEERIDLRLAPAAETLAALLQEDAAGTFDLAFLDADKDAQAGYYEQCLELLRPGGLVAVDNAFLGGDVLAPEESRWPGSARAVRELTLAVLDDPRVDASLVPIGDGLLLARRRARS